MERVSRLRHESDFRAVYRAGGSWTTPLLVLRGRPNGTDATRVGYVTGRRVGTAVVRNRLKRRLREVVRSLDIRPGWDLVLIGRPAAGAASFAQLHGAVAALLRQGKLHAPHIDSQASGA